VRRIAEPWLGGRKTMIYEGTSNSSESKEPIKETILSRAQEAQKQASGFADKMKSQARDVAEQQKPRYGSRCW
jgi:hypothetical protein